MSAEVITTEVDEFLIDQSAVDLKQRFTEIIYNAESAEITREEHFRKFTALYAEAKDWERRIEFLRKEANGPDQDRINVRNDKAREILGPIKQIQSIAKQKCAEWQKLLEQRKSDEEAKLKAAADLLGLDDVPYVLPVEKTTRGDGAMMVTRTVRKYRIVEFDKIPDKYLQLNEELVQRDIKLGIGSIPGLEFYDEQITQLRSR
jgi:hypothetical protein